MRAVVLLLLVGCAAHTPPPAIAMVPIEHAPPSVPLVLPEPEPDPVVGETHELELFVGQQFSIPSHGVKQCSF